MLDTFVRVTAMDFHPAAGRWVDVACTDCDGAGCDECAGQGHLYAWEPLGVHATEWVATGTGTDAGVGEDAITGTEGDTWQGWQIGG